MWHHAGFLPYYWGDSGLHACEASLLPTELHPPVCHPSLVKSCKYRWWRPLGTPVLCGLEIGTLYWGLCGWRLCAPYVSPVHNILYIACIGVTSTTSISSSFSIHKVRLFMEYSHWVVRLSCLSTNTWELRLRHPRCLQMSTTPRWTSRECGLQRSHAFVSVCIWLKFPCVGALIPVWTDLPQCVWMHGNTCEHMLRTWVKEQEVRTAVFISSLTPWKSRLQTLGSDQGHLIPPNTSLRFSFQALLG